MIFFRSGNKSKGNKIKVNKWDYIKLKSFFFKKKKRNDQQNKKAAYGMELNICKSVKGLVSKLHKELIQLNSK